MRAKINDITKICLVACVTLCCNDMDAQVRRIPNPNAQDQPTQNTQTQNNSGRNNGQNNGRNRHNNPASTVTTPEPDADYTSVTDNVLTYDIESKEIRYGLETYQLVDIKGYSFRMGGTPEQTDRQTNEMPIRRVEEWRYYMGRTEVPQWLWVAVMGSNPSANRGKYLPVESVTWYDCLEFIERLNELTGRVFSLPTESQWELAARERNEDVPYQFSGSHDLDEVGWFADNSDGFTHEIATKQPNSLGIYDLSGNVDEWCADWYGLYDASNLRPSRPKGPEEGSHRVYRSGNCTSAPEHCRTARRFAAEPFYSSPYLGFRIVMNR